MDEYAQARSEIEPRARPAGRKRRRWLRLSAALLGLLLIVFAAAWLQRRTIARDYVDRALARYGVAARYDIEQLSPWRQRLTGVVVGDPRSPDLTADWIEIRTAVSPWRAEVLVVRAGTVHLRAAFRARATGDPLSAEAYRAHVAHRNPPG